jgi:hypothetical protein
MSDRNPVQSDCPVMQVDFRGRYCDLVASHCNLKCVVRRR